MNKWVVGNWKMHKTPKEAQAFFESFISLSLPPKIRISFAVPYVDLFVSLQAIQRTPISLGAQNIHEDKEGAFTGETSARMAKEAGCEFTLIGHSERRKFSGETNALINEKIKRAKENNLSYILCIGETLQEREEGRFQEIIEKQITEALHQISDLNKMAIAYEPVWAIGSGRAAQPKEAEAIHLICRELLEKRYGKEAATNTPILYGGSVNVTNVKSFLSQVNIDGVLVGGASLDPQGFTELINQIV